MESANPEAEAEQIAGLIDYLLGGGSHLSLEDDRLRYATAAGQASFKDFAILYRFHALGQMAQKHLEQAGIPCQLAREAAGPEFTGIDLLAEKVSLFTLHAAKGLEFPYVFIIGCEAGLLPYEPVAPVQVDPDEERGLLVTRIDPGQPANLSFFCPAALSLGRSGDRPTFSLGASPPAGID